MGLFDCCGRTLKNLSRAAAKSAAARWRQVARGNIAPDWSQRAETCERCPLRVIHNGISYCGKPFLNQINRDPATDGCGCPCHPKAKSPDEHCPLDIHHLPARGDNLGCNCKWCELRNANNKAHA